MDLNGIQIDIVPEGLVHITNICFGQCLERMVGTLDWMKCFLLDPGVPSIYSGSQRDKTDQEMHRAPLELDRG